MNISGLFHLIMDCIPCRADAEQGFMRHDPMDTDSDSAFWSDLRYLHDLKSEIFSDLRDAVWGGDSIVFNASEGDLYADMCWWFDPPCSQFWPDDIAATQLACWREESEGEAAA